MGASALLAAPALPFMHFSRFSFASREKRDGESEGEGSKNERKREDEKKMRVIFYYSLSFSCVVVLRSPASFVPLLLFPSILTHNS